MFVLKFANFVGAVHLPGWLSGDFNAFLSATRWFYSRT